MKIRHFVDSQKGVIFLIVFGMMVIYRQLDNPTAWLYLALHGGYGWMWVLKSRFFPDRQWEQKASWAFGIAIWAGLSLYLLPGWIIVSSGLRAPGWWAGLCVAIYIFGVFYHFASDMQKTTTLQLRPNQLITEGLWSLSRNPNYFGELLIYGGFSLLAMHWAPFIALAAWVLFVWLPNMRKKDRSLSRYPEFAAYKEKTKMFIPFLF